MAGENIQNLIAYKKLVGICIRLHPVIAKFPKNERFVLGQEIEKCLVSAMRWIVRINWARVKRPDDFDELELELEMTCHFLTLAKEMNFMSTRQFGVAADGMEELSRVVHGWRRSQTGGR